MLSGMGWRPGHAHAVVRNDQRHFTRLRTRSSNPQDYTLCLLAVQAKLLFRAQKLTV